MLPIHAVKQLTPLQFIRMLKLGAKKIIENENKINKLNVFPVSDHDTGTNIASLMRFLFAEEFTYENFSQLFTQIADVSLIGASGNSGIIFSSFFSGFALDQELLSNTLPISKFVTCMHSGVANAYLAVANPVEGTILSVMKAWVNALNESYLQTEDYLSLFLKSVPKTEEALNLTEQQLDILKQNHVVDAGAFAFVLMLQGMLEALQTETGTDVIEEHAALKIAITVPDHLHDAQSKYRYCFESTLLTQSYTNHIQSRLETLGDSLVTTKSPSYLKIHLHTDDPYQATEVIKTIGPIRGQKVDDIHLQYEITTHPKHRIALVIDSSADLPKDFIEEQQIHVIPIQVRVAQNTLLDRLTITLESLYEAVYKRGEKVSTSIPSPESVSRILNFLADYYDSIICITISEKVSGFHQLVLQQAKKISKKKISVINSKNISVAHGLIVMKAAEWVANQQTHDQIVRRVEDLVNNTTFYAAINNFKTVVQSGRMPQSVGSIANLLHFKPVITCDKEGKPALASATIGDKMSIRKLIKWVQQATENKSISAIAISHSLALEKAEKIADLIHQATGIKPIYIRETSATIGVHAGQGCIGVGIISNRE